MKEFIEFLLWLHQLPQTTLGYFLRLFYKGIDRVYRAGVCDVIVCRSLKMNGGLSLGQFVFVGQWAKSDTVEHELGHCIQSQYLGWFYLPFVGFQSLAHAMFHDCKARGQDYDHFWTERWATKLGEEARRCNTLK